MVYLCRHQMSKSDVVDEKGNKYIYCRKTNGICIGQRFCPEQQRYIISERVKNICRDYEDIK